MRGRRPILCLAGNLLFGSQHGARLLSQTVLALLDRDAGIPDAILLRGSFQSTLSLLTLERRGIEGRALHPAAQMSGLRLGFR
jgi:hypothetical protein